MIAYLPYTFLLIAIGIAYFAGEHSDKLTASPTQQRVELPHIKLPKDHETIIQPGQIDKQQINLQAFLPATTNRGSTPLEKSTPSTTLRVAKVSQQKLQLSAIMIANNQRYATLNGSVLAEGETTQAYRVIQIKPDSVLVQGPQGRTRLSLENQ